MRFLKRNKKETECTYSDENCKLTKKEHYCIACGKSMKSDTYLCKSCMDIFRVKTCNEMTDDIKESLFKLNDPSQTLTEEDVRNIYGEIKNMDTKYKNTLNQWAKKCDELDYVRESFAKYKATSIEEISRLKYELEKKKKFKTNFKRIKRSIHDFFDV